MKCIEQTNSQGWITNDIYGCRTAIANMALVSGSDVDQNGWVIIDAGIPFSGSYLIRKAAQLFGDNPPAAIILTHGHFDHIGALPVFLKHWDVPVYAHSLELPYLTGEKNYPPADPSVGGGLMALVSPLYPRKAKNFGNRIRPLPSDGSIPEMPGWEWIHTPGHTEGHVSLFRERDRVVLAGDAFITVQQESAWSVITQTKNVQGPPAYFTPDWERAEQSVRKLADLQPEIAYTGHGRPLYGEELRFSLQTLVDQFDQLAVPDNGKYVHGR